MDDPFMSLFSFLFFVSQSLWELFTPPLTGELSQIEAWRPLESQIEPSVLLEHKNEPWRPGKQNRALEASGKPIRTLEASGEQNRAPEASGGQDRAMEASGERNRPLHASGE